MLAGVRHMSVTRRDVVVAPLSGLLLCFGAIAILGAVALAAATRLSVVPTFILNLVVIMG